MSADVAIVGAGPAGLIAAERLAMTGHSVDIYERKPSPARKFLMAGRGGLNLTHSEEFEKFAGRYREASPFIKTLLEKFTPTDLIAWCEGLGQETFVGSSGRVFPKAMKASPLLRAWLARLGSLGVRLHTGHDWTGWNEDGAVCFANGVTVKPAATLLALGGASWPGLGSDGSWVSPLTDKGVQIAPLEPANCGFHVPWSEIFKTRFAGQPLKNIAIMFGDETVRGEIVVTAKGIEGGAIYALSGGVRDKIKQEGEVQINIDLKPQIGHAELMEKLKRPRGRQSFSTYMQKILGFTPLSISLLREADPDAGLLFPEHLATLIKAVPIVLTAPFGLDRAISTAGGIKLTELNDDMMLTALPGVFACGEMLDWEAPTGGYLLQASFASGIAAASGIHGWLARNGAAA